MQAPLHYEPAHNSNSNSTAGDQKWKRSVKQVEAEVKPLLYQERLVAELAQAKASKLPEPFQVTIDFSLNSAGAQMHKVLFSAKSGQLTDWKIIAREKIAKQFPLDYEDWREWVELGDLGRSKHNDYFSNFQLVTGRVGAATKKS